MRLALIVLLPLLGALLPGLLIRTGRNSCALSAGIPTLLALALLLTHLPQIQSGPVLASLPWIPQLGLELSFRLDGLGFLMAALILSIGLLVMLYARYYLSAEDHSGAFYTYLLLFQTAMLGIVLSDNLLLLVIFWELTSLTSFLLIGFWGWLEESKRGALLALTVTGAGGLALLAAVLILGEVTGTYELSSLLVQSDAVRHSPWYDTILALVLLSCFTKSAQFPFHFWLPAAMAAPTPVSAFLHSATMVKAGVFLLARLWPVLAGTDAWFYAVVTTGMVTMFVGAVVALFKDDLKAILAYSTLSHLGIITMMLGVGTVGAATAAIVHLFNHAVFKAALFLSTGIVDHETGVRRISQLGGLWRWMPITAVVASIAAAANAGLPPMGGFLSKELVLKEAMHTSFGNLDWLTASVVVCTACLSIAYSLRWASGIFAGRSRRDDRADGTAAGDVPARSPHDPPFGLLAPPLLLATLALLAGLWPATFLEPIAELALRDVVGARGEATPLHLQLWHGISPELIASCGAILVGLLLWSVWPALNRLGQSLPLMDMGESCSSVFHSAGELCGRIVEFLQNGSLQRYLFLMLVCFLGMAAAGFLSGGFEIGDRPPLPPVPAAIVAWLLVVGVCLATWVFCRQRLITLITVNAIGLIASIAFVYLSAPDLALTQIAVEVVTVILILLAMYFLPKESPAESSRLRIARDTVIAILAGLGLGGLSWAVMTRDVSTISDYFIAQSKPAAGGANVVNVILVDFRGFDTFNEIIVLGIAALAIYALLDGAMHGRTASRLDHWIPDQPRSPERHPSLFVVPTRVMLPLALMVGIYIFLRGHNQPGGGFVAGLIITIALIMQYMISGYDWANARISINYHAWIGWGLWLTAGAGIGAMVMDYPFLKNAHHHFDWPVIGSFDLASGVVFDTGVLMTVVGAVMLALANLSRLGKRADRAAQRAREQTATQADDEGAA